MQVLVSLLRAKRGGFVIASAAWQSMTANSGSGLPRFARSDGELFARNDGDFSTLRKGFAARGRA
jgi:hypothetical protein